jgi:hypothetical protein
MILIVGYRALAALAAALFNRAFHGKKYSDASAAGIGQRQRIAGQFVHNDQLA